MSLPLKSQMAPRGPQFCSLHSAVNAGSVQENMLGLNNTVNIIT